MPRYLQGDEQISDGVNLLVSILVRFPEVGTVRFDPNTQTLKLTFILSGLPDKNEFIIIKRYILNSIAAYHVLGSQKNTLTDLQLSNHEKIAILTISRDVHSLSRGEIALIIALLREKFKDQLIADQNDSLLEEDLLFQEELIENMLENMKRKDDGHSLIGIREDGRVLVFNK